MDGQRDIVWLTPAGAEMTGADWNAGYAKSLAVCVNGDAITEPGPRGERITDADFILLLNAHSDTVTFRIPPEIGSPGVSWQVVVNTGMPSALAIAPGNGGPGVVAAGVTGGAGLAGAAGAGGDGVPVANGGGTAPAGSGAAGSLATGDPATGHAIEVASRAMLVLRGTKP